MGLTRAEQDLMRDLQMSVDSFDDMFEDESADAPVISKKPGIAKMGKTKGNPSFSAQFDITTYLKYYTLTGGAYTEIAASALSANLKTQLPMFLFMYNDYRAGFSKLRQSFPVASDWSYSIPFIHGRDEITSLALDSAVTSDLQNGDLVIPFTSALPGAGTTTLACVIVRCTQVAVGTLLESLASDRFVLNQIRYVVPDETSTSLAQYAQNIGIFKQSLFGKFDSDYLSPNSHKVPAQQQKNLIDIPLKIGIDKQRGLATYINYDVTYISWSMFVWTVRKLSA